MSLLENAIPGEVDKVEIEDEIDLNLQARQLAALKKAVIAQRAYLDSFTSKSKHLEGILRFSTEKSNVALAAAREACVRLGTVSSEGELTAEQWDDVYTTVAGLGKLFKTAAEVEEGLTIEFLEKLSEDDPTF